MFKRIKMHEFMYFLGPPSTVIANNSKASQIQYINYKKISNTHFFLLHMFIQIFYRIFYKSVIVVTNMIKFDVIAVVAMRTIKRAMQYSHGSKT